jgi:(4S)-4-hydroxy-5-phosphonooxypentane-2,3-dione isomerase
MIVTLVHVWVKPENIDAFIIATVDNHTESVSEPGNLRFDLLQDAGDPTKFVLYEAYESDAAAAAHKETPHYLNWRETVAEMMAQPRKGEKHIIIAPTDRKQW